MATRPMAMQGARAIGSRTVGVSELRWPYHASLGALGGLTVFMALWAGIMPFVSASFGFSPDGAGTFHWDLTRAVLALVPAGAALVAGLSLLQLGRVTRLGLGRVGVLCSGVLAVAAGCWFAIGPAAWPVLDGHRYLLGTGAYSAFERELAFVLGPGLILVVVGGLACQFAILQRPESRGLSVQLVTSDLPVVDTDPLPSNLVATRAPAPVMNDVTDDTREHGEPVAIPVAEQAQGVASE